MTVTSVSPGSLDKLRAQSRADILLVDDHPNNLLTAFETNRLSTEEAYQLGAVDCLVKPIVPVILKAKVAGFIELFQKTEQVKQQAEQLRLLERREFTQ